MMMKRYAICNLREERDLNTSIDVECRAGTRHFSGIPENQKSPGILEKVKKFWNLEKLKKFYNSK